MSNLFSPEELDLFSRMTVCVLSPMNHIEGVWVKSLGKMVAYSWHHGLRIEDIGGVEREVVHWARNNLAKAALESVSPLTGQKYTHFLWLDDDHGFNGDLACQLARHMVDPEIDAISALYFSRLAPYYPVVYVKDTAPNPYTHYPLLKVPNCVCEVDAVGFGAIITKREMFERVEYPWFGFQGGGEDIRFCVHAKQQGFRIFLNGQYKLGHLGDRQVVTEKTYLTYQDEHPEKFKDMVRVELGGKIVGKAA